MPSIAYGLMPLIFALGYTFIVFEHRLRLNKAIPALLMAVLIWTVQFTVFADQSISAHILIEQFSNVAQIVVFLLCALAIVETIHLHGGLQIVARYIPVRSKKSAFWAIGLVSFCLSAVLDNLTTTVVMVMLIRKMIAHYEERLLFGSAVVIAANAGGAWTPIGDVTTTMLWIGGQISSLAIMKSLFLPSVACFVVALFCISLFVHGELPATDVQHEHKELPETRLVLMLGIGALIFVPLCKMVIGLPPFLGILCSMTLLWMATDVLHRKYHEKQYLRMTSIFARIDIATLLFFVGILLSVDGLEAAGILRAIAAWFDEVMPSKVAIATMIGIISAIIDNVPLVAACTGMYDIAQYPTNHYFWQLVAYTAGTGGSMLIIGSAAGVAFMGLEKVDFFWYLRRASLPALLGYFAGILVYLLL